MKDSTKRVLSFALASSVIAGVPVAAHAADNSNNVSIENQANNEITYVVKEGDTLGKIAEKYFGNAGYWEKLAEYNKMEDPNKLAIGDEVKIPRDLLELLQVEYVPYGQEIQAPYEYAPYVPEPQAPCDEFAPDGTYVVKDGDTMYCIVRTQYGRNEQEYVDKLATYNNMSDPNRIVVGQVILIPCFEKLKLVVQNDYTEEYNRMGWILYHQNDCKPCNPCDQQWAWWYNCHPQFIPECQQPVFVPVYPTASCYPHFEEPKCGGLTLKWVHKN